MRGSAAIALGCAAGIFAFAIGMALAGAVAAAFFVGACAGVLTSLVILKTPVVPLVEAATSRGLLIVSSLAERAALSALVLSRLASGDLS